MAPYQLGISFSIDSCTEANLGNWRLDAMSGKPGAAAVAVGKARSNDDASAMSLLRFTGPKGWSLNKSVNTSRRE